MYTPKGNGLSAKGRIPKETEFCVLFVLLNTEDQFVNLWMKIETSFWWIYTLFVDTQFTETKCTLRARPK